ncbi:MAG: hypothetical protein ACI90A_000235 [Shewanella sp.]|jgi:hypothetical protein
MYVWNIQDHARHLWQAIGSNVAGAFKRTPQYN